jgi:hypothetical protein
MTIQIQSTGSSRNFIQNSQTLPNHWIVAREVTKNHSRILQIFQGHFIISQILFLL